MNLNQEIEEKLKALGASFVHCVDITNLPDKETKKFPKAILFGIHLTFRYLKKLRDSADYVQLLIDNKIDHSKDEFFSTEIKTGEIADTIAQWLVDKGYEAHSHSDENQILSGYFDGLYEATPLPHKTIARMAGIGWIGKNTLLITPEYGSACCFGVVATNAPVEIPCTNEMQSKCENCTICKEMCEPQAVKGVAWNVNVQRKEMLDVEKCNACFSCLLFCPWTQNYIENEIEIA
jgi:ferredoxin